MPAAGRDCLRPVPNKLAATKKFGDEPFRAAGKSLQSAHRFRRIGTNEVREALEAASGLDLRPGTQRTADDLIPMFESDTALSFMSDAEKKGILHDTPAKLAPGLADPAAQNAKARVKAY